MFHVIQQWLPMGVVVETLLGFHQVTAFPR